MDTIFLLARRRQIRTTPMRHFRRHANALSKRGVCMYGFDDVYRISAHLDGQHYLAYHVARVSANHTVAQDFTVAVGFR